MAGNTVTLTFAGDTTSLNRAMNSAGTSAKQMAGDVEGASTRIRTSMSGVGSSVAEGIDSSERKFTGLGDTIEGTGDLMEGFRTGNVVLMARGMADLAGGITDFVVPAIRSMATVLQTQMVAAMTTINAHPFMRAILIGGAIIAGLILLEKKFGVVSGSIEWVRDRLSDLWGWFGGFVGDIGTMFGGVASVITAPFRTAFNAIAGLWNNTVGSLSFRIPSWVPGIGGKGFDVPDIPTFHTGGVVPGNPGTSVPIMAMAGETVLRAGQTAGTTIVINLTAWDTRDGGARVVEAIRNYERANGTGWRR